MIEKIKANELKLGDVIQAYEGPFGTAIVKQITDDMVKLYRPYGRADNFSYTGGVICLSGVETYTIWRNNDMWPVWQRGKVK